MKKKIIKSISIFILLIITINSISMTFASSDDMLINRSVSTNESGYKTEMEGKYGEMIGYMYVDLAVNGTLRNFYDGEIKNYDYFKDMIENDRVFMARRSDSILFSPFDKLGSVEEFLEITKSDDFPQVFNLVKDSYINGKFSEELKPYYEDFYVTSWRGNRETELMILTIRPYLPYKVNHILLDIEDGEIVYERVYLEEEKEGLHIDYAKIEGLIEIENETGYKVDYDREVYSSYKKILNKPNKEFNLYYIKENNKEENKEIEIDIEYGHIENDTFINFKDENNDDIKTSITLEEDYLIDESIVDIKHIENYIFKEIKPSLKEGILAKDLQDKKIYVIYEELEKIELFNLDVKTINKKTNEFIANQDFKIKELKTNNKIKYKTDSEGVKKIENLEKGSYKLIPTKLDGFESADNILLNIKDKDKEKIIYYTPIEEIKPPVNPPVGPEEPENPENPEKPKEPEKPVNPGKPEEPENPERPYIPELKPIKPGIDIKDEEKLNRLDHFQYINGYEDNTIRPEDNITREEVAAVFFRLLDKDYREKVRKDKNIFTDVTSKRWSNKHISTLNNAKILTGYEDNTFRPGENITRAEVAAMASRFDDLEVGENMFKDTKGHWAEKYISSASMKGWIKGYEDGTFRPDEYITRAEFVSLINGVLNRKVDKKGLSEINLNNLNSYKDLNENKWYYFDIIEASNSHLYKERTLGKTSEVWTELKEINIEM